MKNENLTVSRVSLRRAIDFLIIPSMLMVYNIICLKTRSSRLLKGVKQVCFRKAGVKKIIFFLWGKRLFSGTPACVYGLFFGLRAVNSRTPHHKCQEGQFPLLRQVSYAFPCFQEAFLLFLLFLTGRNYLFYRHQKLQKLSCAYLLK